jgi:hypothetical protein
MAYKKVSMNTANSSIQQGTKQETTKETKKKQRKMVPFWPLTLKQVYFFFIWFVRLLALRPLMAYRASLG